MFLDCDRMKHTINSSLTGENKTVCFTLSQSKNIFSYLKTTVYSCYSCSRQEGALFFSSSQLSTQANIRFPLQYTVSLVSVF